MRFASEFDKAVAHWSFGLVPSSELPEIAMSLVEQGIDADLIVDLACKEKQADPALHEMFERVLTHLNRSKLSKAEAGRLIALDYAARVVSGEVEPIEGARAIWAISLECDELCEDLAIFGGRVSEAEDIPMIAEKVSQKIVSDARELLQRAES